jgi:tRNA U54 and U55 pseudouridine synthase Pus10
MDDRVKAAEMKFLASGREDMDVRMLGFALECLRKTLSQEELLELEDHSNSHHAGVVVNSLQVVTKEKIEKLKDVEESDDSLVYSIVSGGGNTVDDISDYVFEQVERGRRRQRGRSTQLSL